MNFLWSILLTAAKAAVIEVSDSDIDKYVDNGVPTILDLYASWCGHCKTFAPIFDELAAKYEDQSDKIQFVKVDADENKGAAKKFEVKYFPTIKFLNNGESTDINHRSLESFENFLKKELDLNPDSDEDIQARAEAKSAERLEKKNSEESYVVYTDVDNVLDIVDDKYALVHLIDEDCGSDCDATLDTWERLGKAYARDDRVELVVVEIEDGDERYKKIFNQNTLPGTFLFVPEFEDPISFMGGSSFNALLKTFKNIGAIDRDADGNLTKKSGLLPHLDTSVLPDYDELLEKIEPMNGLTKPIYYELIEKARSDKNYLKSEFKRLKKILRNDETPLDEHESAKIRFNIVNSFVAALVAKKEL